MANPRHVTEAPVSTNPKTGMPSMESWPEMGRATAHPTGATLALGDPSVSLNAMGGLESYHRLEEAPVHGLMVAAWLALEPVALTGAVTACE